MLTGRDLGDGSSAPTMESNRDGSDWWWVLVGRTRAASLAGQFSRSPTTTASPTAPAIALAHCHRINRHVDRATGGSIRPITSATHQPLRFVTKVFDLLDPAQRGVQCQRVDASGLLGGLLFENGFAFEPPPFTWGRVTVEACQ